MASAVGVTALLQITPGKIRAQVVALYYMAISLSGLLIGPVGVGWLSDNVFGEDNLRYAVALLPFLAGILPILLFPMIRSSYLRQMDRLEAVH